MVKVTAMGVGCTGVVFTTANSNISWTWVGNFKTCKISKSTFLFILSGNADLANEMKRIPTKLLLPFLDFVKDAFAHHSNCTDFRFAALAFSGIRRF